MLRYHVWELVLDLNTGHVTIRSLRELPQMLALCLLFLFWGHTRFYLEIPHGQTPVPQVLPALRVDPMDLQAECVEIVRGDLGQNSLPQDIAARLKQLP